MGINYNKLHMYAFYLRRKRFTSERIPAEQLRKLLHNISRNTREETSAY